MSRFISCLIMLAATAGMGICLYWLFIDWCAMEQAYTGFQAADTRGADFRTLFVYATHQEAHRINVFAESLWILLGAVLWMLGFLGFLLSRR